jgi:putative ABC transport system substrate-binding protein
MLRRRDLIKAGLGATALTGLGFVSSATAQSSVRRIGVLIARPETDPEGKKHTAALEGGLAALGWIRNRNLEIDIRWGTADDARRLAFVRELAALKPDVLVINSSGYLRVARQEVRTIPMVFVALADPVAQGFVQSLAHPGGTMTGFGAEEPSMGSKWLELLKELAPETRSVIAIYNPDTAPLAPLFLPSIQAVRSQSPFEVTHTPVRRDDELEDAIAAAARRENAGLIFLPDSYLASRPERIVAAVGKHKLPAVYSVSSFAHNGGLASLGVERTEIFRRAAGYVDRILKGEKPFNLPVQMPDKFELVVNLKTAKTLGLSVPATLLARADEVIE